MLESDSVDVNKSARIAEQKKQDMLSFFWAQPGQSVVTISDGPSEYVEFLDAQVGEAGRILSLGMTESLADIEDSSIDIVIADTIYRKQTMSEFDRKTWLADVHRVMKPDGTFIVAEADAGEDKGTSQVKSPERIEEQLVIDEVRAAGFDIIGHGVPPEHGQGLPNADGEPATDLPVQFLIKFRKPPVPPGL